MRISGCPCLTWRRFRRDPTDALFADQGQSILGNLMELLGRAERMQWRNRGCAVGGRLERLQVLFRKVAFPLFGNGGTRLQPVYVEDIGKRSPA